MVRHRYEKTAGPIRKSFRRHTPVTMLIVVDGSVVVVNASPDDGTDARLARSSACVSAMSVTIWKDE